MGQVSSSESKTNILNEVITDVLMSSSSSCVSSASSSQIISFTDLEFENCDVDFSNISQDGVVLAELSCARDNEQSSELQNKFSNKLDEKLTSVVSSIPTLGANVALTSSLTEVANKIKNTINITTIASCVSDSMAQQLIEFKKIKAKNCKEKITFNNISQQILLTHVASCVEKNKQTSELSNELDNTVKKVLSSESSLGLAAAGVISSVVSSSSIIIIIAIVLTTTEFQIEF